MPKGTTWPRNLHPNTNRPLKNEKFTPKGPLEASNLHPNTNRSLKNEKFTPKGPLDRAIYVQTQTGHSKMSIYARDTNSHIWLTQTHNHTRPAKTNTQDSCKHSRIQTIITHDAHKKKNKQIQNTHIKHQPNMWSKSLTKKVEHNNVGGT